MKLRWKLLILLLLTALAPLLAVRVATVIGIRSSGRELSQKAESYLIEQANQNLQYAVAFHAAQTGREGQLIQALLEVQRQAVLKRLAAPPPTESATKPYYTPQSFDDPNHRPPGTRPSALHARVHPDGARSIPLVSYECPVIYISPGSDSSAIGDDLVKLPDMADVYNHIRQRMPDAIFWQYTSLENGLHISFPGKGGYPNDYDPRKRYWYRQTKRDRRTGWHLPTRDITTGREVFNCTAPLIDDTGRFLGVTAIDVPFERLLGASRLPRRWRSHVRMSFVRIVDQRMLDDLGIADRMKVGTPLVFARGMANLTDDTWEHVESFQQVRADTDEQTLALQHAMTQQREGTLEIRYDGRPMICAFGCLEDMAEPARSFIVLMIPREQVLAESQQVARQLDMLIWQLLAETGGAMLIAIALVALLALAFSKRITQPVTELADAAQAIADGELDRQVAPGTNGDELSQMSDAFNAMVPKLRDRMKLRESLSLAMEVQQSLLPTGPPNINGLDIAGHSQYCDETGGDYYDFIDFDDLGADTLGVVIGDVTGHGIAAALLMATGRALLRSGVTTSDTLAKLFNEMNRHLIGGQFSGRFMTMFYLLLDARRKKMRWLSAGHDPAIVYNPAHDKFTYIAGSDIPLGVDHDWQFNEFESDDWPGGCVLVLGTDGIWEARNGDGRMFMKQRLETTIKENAHQSARHIAAAISNAVHAFRGDMAQLDDITMVVVKFE